MVFNRLQTNNFVLIVMSQLAILGLACTRRNRTGIGGKKKASILAEESALLGEEFSALTCSYFSPRVLFRPFSNQLL